MMRCFKKKVKINDNISSFELLPYLAHFSIASFLNLVDLHVKIRLC